MQSKIDSWIEASTNTAVGFIISWLAWLIIIDPLFGFHASTRASFLITCIFTIVSLLRQYILRRLFNGRSVGLAVVRAINGSSQKEQDF